MLSSYKLTPSDYGWITIILGIAVLQYHIAFHAWGALGLVIYFFLLLIAFKPTHGVHPNNFIFGYYFLWLVCPSVVDWYFQITDWDYVLPWGRLWEWDAISSYTLLQVQVTMTLLIVVVYFACGQSVGLKVKEVFLDNRAYFARIRRPIEINILLWLLVILFIQRSGGLNAWITDYSFTYLTGRAGLGVVNVTIIALGSFSVLILGLRNFGRNGGGRGILPLLPLIFAMGFVGGFKSRLIILLFFFFLPYLVTTRVNFWLMIKYVIGFFGILYLLTLVRSQGFYSSGAGFLELIPSYFNVFPLHDMIVQRQPPDILTTAHFPFTKIAQAFGWAGIDAEFDISVMLTKEYFPDQWYNRSATQQWPLETELYLNYYGIVGQAFPLIIYGLWISFLFRAVVIKQNWLLYPMLGLELFRIISVLRGTLIPWIFPVLVVQYISFYLIGALYFPRRKVRKAK